MKTFVDREPTDVRIEIVPLIDVVFCVLTFFILAAVGLTRYQGLGIDLPKTQAAPSQFGDKLPVQVNAVGQIFVKNQPVSQEGLVQELQAYITNNPNGLVVVDADRLANYEQVVQLLDLLQSLGITRIALGSVQQQGTGAVPNQGAPFPGLNGGQPGTQFAPNNPGLQPGITQPGITQPGLNQPGLNQPGLNQPGLNQPGLNQPGVSQPGANPVSPSNTQPNIDLERSLIPGGSPAPATP
jgi:biopolymer transport protein ExbD